MFLLLTFKKSSKFFNFLNVSVSLPIGAAGPVPPIYWCYHVSCTNIGATDMVAPLVLVKTYGQNLHHCLHFEYNDVAVLGAPIIAYTDMFTMCDVYSVHLV